MITHKIKEVTPETNLNIKAVFFDGTVKLYDLKNLFPEFPQFMIFEKNDSLFSAVKVDAGGYGISWNEELDLDAETVWECGITIERTNNNDINRLLAYYIMMCREKKNITQKELSERTGIYQAEISKLERGIGNPSVQTLKRIADGLDMDLKIEFIPKGNS